MKKLFLLFFMFLSISIVSVNAASIYGAFDFTVYDNKTYNLETGAWEDNINYSSTNRVIIPLNSEDNTLYFNSSTFHHIVFFNKFNNYIGYSNTAATDLELSLYIGYDVADNKIIVPDNAAKFALVVYNFNDSLIYDIWEGLSYNDITLGNNEFSSFPDTYPLGNQVYNLVGTNNYYGTELFNINSITDTATTQYIDRDFSVVKGATFSRILELTNTVMYYHNDIDDLGLDIKVNNSQVANATIRIGNILYSTVYSGDITVYDFDNTFAVTYGVGRDILIRVDKTLYPTIIDFENYLQANDVEFIYELETPVTNNRDIYYYNYNDSIIYNISDIFVDLNIPSETQFNTILLNGIDPYAANYSEYLFAINLANLDIQYKYDNTPAEPLDVQNSIDDTLNSIGGENDNIRVFLALGIMVIAAILIGIKTKNSMFVIMTEAVLVLLFGLLGWFSFWILALITLICVLLLFRFILKKE